MSNISEPLALVQLNNGGKSSRVSVYSAEDVGRREITEIVFIRDPSGVELLRLRKNLRVGGPIYRLTDILR